MVTIKDIAREAKVSATTVSYVLNGDERISAETYTRVMLAAQTLGYTGKAGKRREAAAPVAEQSIVFCVHTISGDFYRLLIESVKKVLDMNQYRLFVYMGDDIAHNPWASGYIILNSMVPDEQIAELAQQEIPAVLLDRMLHAPNTLNVLIDNFGGMRALVAQLIERGCRTFAFVGGPNGSYDGQARYEGFCAALADAGLDASSMAFIRGDYTVASGKSAVEYLLRKGALPQAIVCANDDMAIGVRRGVPKEAQSRGGVIVSGFDGFEELGFPTVRADIKSWGSVAAYSVIELIQQKSAPRDDILIPVEVCCPAEQ